MMLGHMGEFTHNDGKPVKFIILFDLDIMDVTILYLNGQLIKSFYIHKCV